MAQQSASRLRDDAKRLRSGRTRETHLAIRSFVHDNVPVPNPDPLPVTEETTPPVLSYANLRGLQPSDSRFVCEVWPDGVRLTEEPSPTAGQTVAILSGLLLVVGLLGAIMVVNQLNGPYSRHGDWIRLIFPVLFLVFPGALGCWHVYLLRRRAIEIEIRGGNMTARVPAMIFRQIRRKVTPTLHLHTMGRGLGYIPTRGKLGLLGCVCVRRWLVFRRIIVANRPVDECDWIVRELRLGIQRSLEPPA
jgi:hypothetical protein